MSKVPILWLRLLTYKGKSSHKAHDHGQEIAKEVDESKNLDNHAKKWPFEEDEGNAKKEAASSPELLPSREEYHRLLDACC